MDPKSDPYPHFSRRSDSDPVFFSVGRIRFFFFSRFDSDPTFEKNRIRVKPGRIRNPAFYGAFTARERWKSSLHGLSLSVALFLYPLSFSFCLSFSASLFLSFKKNQFFSHFLSLSLPDNMFILYLSLSASICLSLSHTVCSFEFFLSVYYDFLFLLNCGKSFALTVLTVKVILI